MCTVQYPTLGEASAPAHAVISGPPGNQPAADVYGPCCLLNISAVSSAFTGGQAARDYQSVSKQDINGTAAMLQTSLEQSARGPAKADTRRGNAGGTYVYAESEQ